MDLFAYFIQPHIVELKDIRSASSGAELSITRKDLLSDGYLQTTSDDESVFLSEESEELWDQGSMTEINEGNGYKYMLSLFFFFKSYCFSNVNSTFIVRNVFNRGTDI